MPVFDSVNIGGVQYTLPGTSGQLTPGASIDGVLFTGQSNISHYAVCNTAGSVANKAATVNGFTLEAGATVSIKFVYANTAESPTLNISSTGAVAIKSYGTSDPISGGWEENEIVSFRYDGTYWMMQGVTHAELETKQDTLTFDDVPVRNSSNPVKSGGIWTKNKEIWDEANRVTSAIAMIAHNYDQSQTYNVGDYCVIYDYLWRCKVAVLTPESFNWDHWERIVAMEEIRENYAKVDGAYETLTSGNAEQLLSTQYVEDSVPYIFRPSGNHADIGDREFDTLVGGSIVWNQLMPTERADTTGTEEEVFGRVTGEDNICTVGHKYFVSVDVASLSNMADCRMRYPAVRYLFAGKNQFIVDAINTDFVIELESSDGSHVEVSLPANFAMICDLTLMFGSAVADYIYNLEAANTGAGVAYLLNLIPLLGGDYLPQNAGTMLSVNASAHETVGFNQWDEEWELGAFNDTNGEEVASTARIRTKSYVPVISGTDYYINTAAWSAILGYDADKTFVTACTYTRSGSGYIVHVPSTVCYVRWAFSNAYGTTYKNDVNFNISWNGTRNGEYEPYEKRTYLLTEGELYPATTLRGVPVVENSKVKYDGDIYNADGTVERRYGVVDLGTLAWNYGPSTAQNKVFYSPSLDATMRLVSTGNGGKVVCEKYATDQKTYTTIADKCVSTISSGLNSNQAIVVIRDTDYTDTAAFKAAMSGVMLVYELATPTTESATPYQSPQIVDDWGTERYVDFEYSVGQRPIPVPVGHETKYPANLRDKVQHLPGLADADGTYAIQQVGTQMSLTSLSLFGLLSSGAPELHRMIYRGKNLGTSFTAAQKAAIANGSFNDLWLGDYWVIGGVTYVVADFDYWYQCGDTAFTKHHIVVMPKKNMYNAQMNATNITTGGYYGSAMRGADVEGTFTPYASGCGLYNALTAFQAAFGDALLTHREYLCNAVTDGKESGGAWFDSVVDLPSEIMVYGTSILTSSPRLATIDTSQLALFAASHKFISQDREYYWLRDVVSATHFSLVYYGGIAYPGSASQSFGVRPVAAVGG